MADTVELFPGFPLPLGDYAPLLRELAESGATSSPIRVAHSLGALQALSSAVDIPTALLAPSVPGRRVGRWLPRWGLRLASRVPGNQRLAVRLRASSYQRYGATAPEGAPLALNDAASRLRPINGDSLTVPSRVVVVCSRDDPRHAQQVAFARRLGAPVRWVDGGHMFPIVNPTQTAAVVAHALLG